jgi:UDP-N-acetylglucosamine 2-epimerase (non-hydrolysing)
MNDTFFRSLNIGQPDINLGIGSGSHAEQVGYTMIAFEKVLLEHRPDWVVVVGDVNATIACSIAAKKLRIKVCHIEAGLRSGDMGMPEEINRLVTDRLSDLLLTPDHLSTKNLINEGIDKSKIAFVGNIMIDTLDAQYNKAASLSLDAIVSKNQLLQGRAAFQPPYTVVTLHRPSNVDIPEVLSSLVDFFINDVTPYQIILWPIHPRTLKMLEKFGLWAKVENNKRIIVLHPLDYHDMLRLNMDASVMVTDSGGLQEECTVLGTPCLTLRYNTERPVTLKEWNGVSVLVGNDINKIREEYQIAVKQKHIPIRPELWDGKTADRCLQQIISKSGI